MALVLTALIAETASSAQNVHAELKIDARSEPNPATKGALFSLSPNPKLNLPIRLRITFPRPSDPREVLADFAILNVSSHPVKLPISTREVSTSSYLLSFNLTSEDAKIDSSMLPWCAELYGSDDNARTVKLLAPNDLIIVHSRCRFPALAYSATFIGHATLFELKSGTPSLVGFARSRPSHYRPPK